jgi:hypothetical protein
MSVAASSVGTGGSRKPRAESSNTAQIRQSAEVSPGEAADYLRPPTDLDEAAIEQVRAPDPLAVLASGRNQRLDERDARRPLTRADLHSQNDETAARVVADGGGIQAVIDATGLRTRENVVGLIDPAILERALDNDVLERGQHPQV